LKYNRGCSPEGAKKKGGALPKGQKERGCSPEGAKKILFNYFYYQYFI